MTLSLLVNSVLVGAPALKESKKIEGSADVLPGKSHTFGFSFTQ